MNIINFNKLLSVTENSKYRLLMTEPVLFDHPKLIYFYTKTKIKNRWPEAEQFILHDSEWACWYAREIIKGRWPAAEPIIMTSADNAYWYAKEVLKGRWPEAEPYISTHKWALNNYNNFLKLQKKN